MVNKYLNLYFRMIALKGQLELFAVKKYETDECLAMHRLKLLKLEKKLFLMLRKVLELKAMFVNK